MSGEVAALMAALLWAISSLIYQRLGRTVSPLWLNFSKGVVAIALLGVTLLLAREAQFSAQVWPLILLLLSGAIGIGLGDVAYFAALNSLGPRRTLLLEALAPALAALLALLTLQERLDLRQITGIGLTMAGIIWVLAQRTPSPDGAVGFNLQGVVFAVFASVGQASGAVLSRGALTSSTIDPLWSTLLRLLGAQIILISLLRQRNEPNPFLQDNRRSLLTVIAITAFFSTYLGIWLQQIALTNSPVGIAQALTSTSPLFILPLVAWSGERLGGSVILGTGVAVAGVWLLVVP
jgi:drug/metabolite transporter (DMT)-like permease